MSFLITKHTEYTDDINPIILYLTTITYQCKRYIS